MDTPAGSSLSLRGVTEAATGQPYRGGNRLVILQNGDEIFPAMIEAVQSARQSIEFCTYVYWKSRIASQFADALIERAQAGVAVRLLIDAVGGAIMDTRTLWRLERAGVKVAWFRPFRWPYLHKFNNRTHRKILIIDGQIGFTGGVGIAAEWTGHAQTRRHWRETHCQIEGPACLDLYAGFTENWREAAREELPSLSHTPEDAGHMAVQTTISTAGHRSATQIDMLFAAVFQQVQHQLHITTAYFVPSDEICELLEAAAGRGVKVRVLTNGPLTNHKITRLAGRASYDRLLDAGIEIYEYNSTVLHTKCITADGHWATVGSANLDGRSLVHNDELNIAFGETHVTKQLDVAFADDLNRSTRITTSTWSSRGWANKLAEQSTFLVRNQL